MNIQNSTINDHAFIFELYEIATAYQKERYEVSWPSFDPQMVTSEILENRQFKLLIDGQIACVWAITYDDPLIWEEKNIDPSIYIHRIATNPNFRGQNFVKIIVDWAKAFAKKEHKNYIRLDTVGENIKLISHYTKCGFDFVGLLKLKNTKDLPAHYHNATVSLFEIQIIK